VPEPGASRGSRSAAAAPVVVIRGGTVVDAGGERRADVVVRAGTVVEVAPDAAVPRGATVLDAGGCLVAPGLVDLHVHLREPGAEEAETVESGARAAALGGYTAVVAMPNTDPPIDSAAVADEVLALGRGQPCEVLVAGAITVGRRGERLAPMRELAALGISLFTDDGNGVQDGGLMRRALEYARGLGVTLAQHCEDATLAAGGVMHEGAWSSRLGLPGIPAAAEETMLARDLALVALTGSPMHFLHVSTRGSVELLAGARAKGLKVSAEVTPHHLALTEESVATYDPVFRVNPPLRTKDDALALAEGLARGTIDAIATDHAPHPPEDKDRPFDQAPPGMLGLETALSVSVAALAGVLSPEEVLARLTTAPARIARVSRDVRPPERAQGGPLEVGVAAHVCVFDPDARWTLEPSRLASRSRNSPFTGAPLQGRVRHTVFAGEPVVVDGELTW
jgi:dihydroorotase